MWQEQKATQVYMSDISGVYTRLPAFLMHIENITESGNKANSSHSLNVLESFSTSLSADCTEIATVDVVNQSLSSVVNVAGDASVSSCSSKYIIIQKLYCDGGNNVNSEGLNKIWNR